MSNTPDRNERDKRGAVLVFLMGAALVAGCAHKPSETCSAVITVAQTCYKAAADGSTGCGPLSSAVASELQSKVPMDPQAKALVSDLCEFGCRAQREHYQWSPVEGFVEARMCPE